MTRGPWGSLADGHGRNTRPSVSSGSQLNVAVFRAGAGRKPVPSGLDLDPVACDWPAAGRADKGTALKITARVVSFTEFHALLPLAQVSVLLGQRAEHAALQRVALDVADAALDLALVLGVPRPRGQHDRAVVAGEGRHLNNLGDAYLKNGQAEQAVSCLELALANARELSLKEREATRGWGLGEAYEAMGRYAEAIQLMELGVAWERETSNPDFEKHEAHLSEVRRKAAEDPG